MLVTSAMLSFDSSAFPVEEGEDSKTNPGLFGKSLGEWLVARLGECGVKATGPFSEDWGWMVEVPNPPLRMGLACCSEDFEKTAWRVYAFVDLGLVDRFRRKDEANRALGELFDRVKDILARDPAITNLRTDEDRP
jgi:hypothetical protein